MAARPPAPDPAALAGLADGAPFLVRVTPGARDEAVAATGERALAVRVAAPPADGAANAAVIALLARALGVPKTRITLLRGASGRIKLFRVRPP
jgi:uncharacterized protein